MYSLQAVRDRDLGLQLRKFPRGNLARQVTDIAHRLFLQPFVTESNIVPFILHCDELITTMSWISPIQSVHPLALYFIQKTTIIFLLAFTSSSSLLRYAPFPLLLYVSFSLLPYYRLYIPESANILAVAGEVLMGHLEYLEKLLLSQWSFENKGPIAERIMKKVSHSSGATKGNGFNPSVNKSSSSTFWSRISFGLWVGTSQRYINTPHQTLNTPPYSSTHPTHIPSRTAFFVRKACIIFSCILLLDVVTLSHLTPRNHLEAYSIENTRLLPQQWKDISGQWGLTRIRSTLGFWTENFAGIQIYYSMLTATGIGLGLSSPADRRPVFGSIMEACTLREYWG